ncbi:MAG TPA: hypothetical protein VFV34_02785, partial [Blastocatellia bacterium]|nr:hypothetical protein [Blastocatellia bacterium]
RMIRATLLYDTVAAQLYCKIDVFREFEKYSRSAAKRIRRDIEASVIRQVLLGPDDSTFLKVRQIANVGNELLYRAQKFLDDPDFSLAAVAGKIYSAIRSFANLFLTCIGATLTAVAIALVVRGYIVLQSPKIVVEETMSSDAGWRLKTIVILWFVTVLVLVFSYTRRVYFRFGDIDD